MNAKYANLGNCHSERSEESAFASWASFQSFQAIQIIFYPKAAAEQIPHRFRVGKPQRKGFGMTR
jgi:hypothetical protein